MVNSWTRSNFSINTTTNKWRSYKNNLLHDVQNTKCLLITRLLARIVLLKEAFCLPSGIDIAISMGAETVAGCMLSGQPSFLCVYETI